MKIMRVGGSVRDELLKSFHPYMDVQTHDRDYVMIDATITDIEQLTAKGFREVGSSFPGVYLHPVTADQYCIPRSTRSGYNQLIDDLMKRDLTCNAIAVEDDGRYVDPFNGMKDIKDGILRHVSKHFADDPVRVLRIGRFVARFGFDVADETIEMIDHLRDNGELDHLQPDRVILELTKGIMEKFPQSMITFMYDNSLICHAFTKYALIMVDNLLPLSKAAHADEDLHVRLAVALCDFWKRMTDADLRRFTRTFNIPKVVQRALEIVHTYNEQLHNYHDLDINQRLAFIRSSRRIGQRTELINIIDKVLVYHGYSDIVDMINSDVDAVKSVEIVEGMSSEQIKNLQLAAFK